MKNNNEIGFETLNAYVDGELDAAQAAEVALAIADSPHLAKQVAALTKLRSAVIESIEMPSLPIDPQPVKQSRMPMLAACIAGLIFLAGSVLTSVSFDRPIFPMWYTVASDALENWPNDNSSDAQSIVQAGFQDSVALVRAYVPDLSAGKLFISHVMDNPVNDNLIVGYRGTRGCRIALAIFSGGASFPDVREKFSKNGRVGYAWRAGRYGYAIIADGMADARFNLIVESVHEASLRHQPADDETRTALRQSRLSSAPCRA